MIAKMLFVTPNFKTVFNPTVNAVQSDFLLELEDSYYNSETLNAFLAKHNLSDNYQISHDKYENENYLTLIIEKPILDNFEDCFKDFFEESFDQYISKLNDLENPHFRYVDKLSKESTLPKKENFKGLNKLTIEKIEKERKQLHKIKQNENLDEKVKRLEKLATRQQDLLESLITDESLYLSQISQFNNYRSLALRGLSFMAGGHEMCGIFDSLKYFIKNNKDPETQRYLNDFNRLEEIFKGQTAINGAPDFRINNSFTGSVILKYCNLTFGGYKNKKLTLDKDIENFSAEFPLNQANGLTIVSNLVRNAYAFADSNIEVKWINNLIVVSDDGKGVAREDINKLFKTGFSKRRNGHGLGLFLCKEKALETKCDIYLDPDNKYTNLKGASFIFDLKGKYLKNNKPK